jgi:hypothetical protein
LTQLSHSAPSGERAVLANRLFAADGLRFGWEFAARQPVPFPDEHNQPERLYAPEPDLAPWIEKRQLGRRPRRLLKSVGIAFVLLIIASMISGTLAFIVFLAGAGMVAWPLVWPSWQIKQLIKQHRAEDARLDREFRQALEAWTAAKHRHEAAEREADGSAPNWYPVQSWSAPGRVDVFGSTGDGWASMVATLGGSLLGAGESIFLLDFSEEHVGGGLAACARNRQVPTTLIELPADSPTNDVLGGLDAEAVADVVSSALHGMRRGQPELRALDHQLLSTLAARLAGPMTFTRLVAAVNVVRRIYLPGAEEPLSPKEFADLTEHVDTIGTTDRVQQELQALATALEPLAKAEAGWTAAASDQGPWWPPAGFATLATGGGASHLYKSCIDQLLLHRVLHELRTGRHPDGPWCLVVAGADELGRDSLELLTRHARRAHVRLVLMFEHLREETADLAGGSDSSTILMRLGQWNESEQAAKLIGRGHTFVMSSITQNWGDTLTDGTADATGGQSTLSRTRGTSRTKGFGTSSGRSNSGNADALGIGGGMPKTWTTNTGRNRSWSTTVSESVTQSRTESWQRTVNFSKATTHGGSETRTRTYEFTVEPTQIQGLAPTAFVLIDAGPAGRRVTAGDCNPGITLLPSVSARPRVG